jgi:hypothetical protein
MSERSSTGTATPIANSRSSPGPKEMTGQLEAMCCYADQSVGDVDGVETFSDIIEAILGDTEA